jgi:hypothetical protein
MEIVMASAIGSLPSPGVVPTPGSSTAGTEAQIARYKKELADCVNCESANTTEGKAAIAAAATKVSNAEARIASMSASSQGSSTDTSTTTTSSDSSAKAYEGTLTYERPVATESGATSKLSDASAGTNVSIFA